MNLFRRKPKKRTVTFYPPEEYEPVIRCSICTGEQTACMKNRTTGKLTELMLIRTPEDLEEFCLNYEVEKDTIKKIY